MKHKGINFINDIKQLKKMKAASYKDSKKKKEYIDQLLAVAKKHGVNKRTIYRELNKKDSKVGIRKTREDAGKVRNRVTAAEKRIVTELVTAGKSKKDAVKEAEKILNKKISDRKSRKIKPSDKILESDEVKTFFCDTALEFFERLFKYDLMGVNTGIRTKFKGVDLFLPKEDLHDILLIVTNAYNRKQPDNRKLKLDRNQLLKSRLFHLLEQQVRIAKESLDLKAAEAVVRMFERLEIEYKNLSPDLKTVEAICHELRPDITFEEIYSLIEKHSDHE